MKDHKEFLNGMWHKVEILEKQQEKESVFQRDKEIKKKQLLIFIAFAFVFIAVFTTSLFVSVDAFWVFILSIVMIIVSIKLEFMAMKTSVKVG
jgi:uncharacterized oligopeptide transporter (OPT) family protein